MISGGLCPHCPNVPLKFIFEMAKKPKDFDFIPPCFLLLKKKHGHMHLTSYSQLNSQLGPANMCRP